MTPTERIATYERLADEVAAALEAGEPIATFENQLRALRFHHALLPNQRKNDSELEIRAIEETIANLRREEYARNGGGGVRYLPIVHKEPGCCEDSYCR